MTEAETAGEKGRHVMFATAGWLLQREAGETGDVGELAAGAEQVCRKLRAVLREIVGDDGYSAVLARAEHLAQADRPYLAGLVRGGGGECLPGLSGTLARQGPVETRQGLTSLFDHVLQVLSSLMTPELVMRQIERAWPDLPQFLLQAALEEQPK